MEKNLKHTDDFLLDDDFHEYIMEPSQQRERKWAVFFEKNPETRTEAEKAKKIILGLTSFKDSTSENEINEFHLLHNFERAFKSYRESKSKKTFVTASKWVWRSVAAAAVIVFMVTSYALVTHYIDKTTSGGILSEIYVPAAKQSQLTLPDGSVVWINSDTKIKYSSRFNTRERNIYLDGEAYFEVAPNRKLPFRVFSSGTEVRALGTKFNVKAYPADKQVETVLLEGKIEFRRTESAKSRVIALQPGDKIIYNLQSQKVSVTRENTDTDVAWKDGKVIFRNTPLAEVCHTLERWYNAEISLADDTGELSSHPFTFTIEGETLPLVLEYLCQAAPLRFKTEYVDEDGEKGIEKIKYVVQSKKSK